MTTTTEIGMLAVGSVYHFDYSEEIPPPSRTLEPNRMYRTVCVDEDDIVLECQVFERWKDAHRCALDMDSLYDHEVETYWTERSIDGGKTWKVYAADEFIAGRPAWTHDNL